MVVLLKYNLFHIEVFEKFLKYYYKLLILTVFDYIV